jgi:putative ABC transport system permease protein
MKTFLRLAARSAWNRRFVLSLAVLSIALSTFLLVGIERIRSDVHENFAQSVSGTDLIVGARTGPVQLVLYAVFRIGAATNNMRWTSVEALSADPAVAWTVPISLGDSHQGFPVLGTTPAYFEHFRYGDGQPLVFRAGKLFDGLFEAVLGADVADALGYRLGDHIVLSHGIGNPNLPQHTDKPFVVTGILARTGTPVDRTVHVSLAAIEAIHLDWQGGAPIPGFAIPADMVRKFDLTPKTVTAVLVGLKNRAAVFAMQRRVAGFKEEPLMGVLPGVALDELWQVIGIGERALLVISTLVAAVSLAGLVAVVLASLNERRRELAILRALGAGPRHILLLLALEGALIATTGTVIGVVAVAVLLPAIGPLVLTRYGLALSLSPPTPTQQLLVAAVLGAGWVASLIPAYRAYRYSLIDGLTSQV